MCLSAPKIPDPKPPFKPPAPPAEKGKEDKSGALAKRKYSKKTGPSALVRKPALAIRTRGAGANVNV